jgi:hypothetical protein
MPVLKGVAQRVAAVNYIATPGPQPVGSFNTDIRDAKYPAWSGRSQDTPIEPAAYVSVKVSNPLFAATTWLEINASIAATRWQFTVSTYPGGVQVAQFWTQYGRNYEFCPVDLAPGEYTYSYFDPVNNKTSATFQFTVATDAISINWPTFTDAYTRASTKARPRCKPADLSHYQVGGANYGSLQRLQTICATYPGTPVPADAIGSSQQESIRMQNLLHAFWITGDVQYQTEAIRRATTWIDWPKLAGSITIAYDDDRRFYGIMLSLFYDTFGTVCGQTIRDKCHAQAGYRLYWPYFVAVPKLAGSSAHTLYYTYGLEPLQSGYFAGHWHNEFAVENLIASGFAGDEATFSASYDSLAAQISYLVPYSGVTLYYMDPTIAHDGSNYEHRGYSVHALDFHDAMCALGNIYGINYAALPKQKAFARTMALLYPPADSFHRSGTGDDTSLQDDRSATYAGRAAGSVVESSLSFYVAGETLTSLEGEYTRSNCWLSPYSSVSLSELTYKDWHVTLFMAAAHSDMLNKLRQSFYFPLQTYLSWNHAEPSAGSRYISSNGQALLRKAGWYDSTNTRFQYEESGWSLTQAGTVGMDGHTAGQAGVKHSNFVRRNRSFAQRVIADKHIFAIARNLTESYAQSTSQPVRTGTGNGYIAIPAAKEGCTEQTITALCNGTTWTISGSVSGALGSASSLGGAGTVAEFDNPQCYFRIVVGSVAPVNGDTFTFKLWKVTSAHCLDVKIGNVALWFQDFVAPTARTWSIALPTADVQLATSVIGNGTTVTATLTHDLPLGIPVTAEVSGATGGFTGLNAIFTVTPATATTVTWASAISGTATGAIRLNFAPSVTAANEVCIQNKMNAAAPLAKMKVTPVLPVTSVTANLIGWASGNTNPYAGTINAAAHELALAMYPITHQHPVVHVCRNRFNYASSTNGLFGCVAAIAVEDAEFRNLSQVITGTAPNRVATVSVDVENTTYIISWYEATKDYEIWEFAPSFDLDAASPALPPGTVFSRNCLATQIYADGSLDWSPNNLITASENLAAAVWIPQGITVGASNSVLATLGSSYLRQIFSASIGQVVGTLQFCAAAGTAFQFSIYNAGMTVQLAFADVIATGLPQRVTVTYTNPSVQSLHIAIGGGSSFTTPEFIQSVQFVSVSMGARGGYVPSAAAVAYAPRIDYSHKQKVPAILCEGQVTNLVTDSRNIRAAAWAASAVTKTLSGVTGPDGVTLIELLTETATTSFHDMGISVGTLTAQSYAASFVAKWNGRHIQALMSGAAGTAYVNFDLQAGVVGSAGNGGVGYITPLINGYYLCEMVFTAAAGAGTFYVALANSTSAARDPSYLGDGTSGVYLDDLQFEAGGRATSRIRTFGSTAIRLADNITYPAAAVSQYNQSAGTWQVKYMLRAAASLNAVIRSDAGSLTAPALTHGSATSSTSYVNNNAVVVNSSVNCTQVPLVHTLSYDSANIQVARTGITASSSFATITPAASNFYFGSNNGSSSMNGWIFFARYYPGSLTAVKTQQLT